MIPNKLRRPEFRFILLNGKIPFEKDWQKSNNYSFDKIPENQNYGVLCGCGNLLVIDFDNEKVQEKILPKLKKTFTIRAGGGLLHKYFICKDGENLKVLDKDKNTLADVQFKSKQVVGPGSIHPNGKKYVVVDDSEIETIDFAEVKALFSEWLQQERPQQNNGLVNKPALIPILQKYGIDTSKNPTNCLLHSSKGGKCFSFNDEVYNCFHCGVKGDVINFVMQAENCEFIEACEILKINLPKKASSELNMFSPIKEDLAEQFYKKQPFFYDHNGFFWFWNCELFCYEMRDEQDLMNALKRHSQNDNFSVVGSQYWAECIRAMKLIGREHKPKDKPIGWIQFQDTLIYPKTLEKMKAGPEYFLTNPIPHKLGVDEETPALDKIYSEWIIKEGQQDKSFVDSLYEATAYAITDDRFLQRIFAFTGGGSNGKGTYFHHLKTFVGEGNCVSSDVSALNGRFGTSPLYKKLLCFCGEVQYDDLKNTNQIKKLSGEDLLNYEFKGKTSFSEQSITGIYIATNSLPVTPDKSKGFYRRWQIIDFPNQFEIKHDFLNVIPTEEYENLCLKCVNILNRLYSNPKLTNEGSFEQREGRYEERSNPILSFIQDYCQEEIGERIMLKEFSEAFNQWLKSKSLRLMNIIQIGKCLRLNGFQTGVRKLNDNSAMCVLDLNLISKTNQTNQTNAKGKLLPYVSSVQNFVSSVSSVSFQDKIIEKIKENEPNGIKEVDLSKNFIDNLDGFFEAVDYLKKKGEVLEVKPGVLKVLE